MELRFKVNQAEAFRRGISVPKSIVRVSVDPAALDQTARDLIADRMDGIDVCVGVYDKKTKRVKPGIDTSGDIYAKSNPVHIEADADTLEALLKAIHADDVRLQADRRLVEAK